jgi:hypothetical protein
MFQYFIQLDDECPLGMVYFGRRSMKNHELVIAMHPKTYEKESHCIYDWLVQLEQHGFADQLRYWPNAV